MTFNRRDFLRLVGGSTAGAAIIAACRPAVREFIEQSPVRIPEDLVSGIDNWYATVCRQCGSGCGTVVRVMEGRVKKIEGNPSHPLNEGKLCVRGHASLQAIYNPDRIRRPMRAVGRGSGQFQEISWDEALNELRDKLGKTDGSRVALVTDPLAGTMGSVVSRFVNAYGAEHFPFEPLDQGVLRQAVRNVFGQEVLPDFDFANANYVLGFGADFLGGWVSQVRHSRGYGEFRQGDRRRGTFVQVDSRFSMTAVNGDEWVWVRPGAEGKLALSIAHVIVREGLAASGSAEALFGPNPASTLESYAPERASEATGVSPARIEEMAKNFAAPENQPAMAIGGGSAGAHTNGVFNLSAIYALNHLVGSVGKPGGVVFNPEAPIGGGPDFNDSVAFTAARTSTLEDMRRLTQRLSAGQVDALLVRNADPVHGLPGSLRFEDALNRVGFIASFSSFLDDTTYHADLVLPGSTALEDWGDVSPDPAPGHQVVGLQQPVVLPFQESRGFVDVLLAVAQDLGLERELPWTGFKEALRENAQKLQQLGRGNVSGASFEAYWIDLLKQGGWWDKNATSSASPAPRRMTMSNPDAEIAGAEDPGRYEFYLVPFSSLSLDDGRNANLPWMQATPDPVATTTWETWVEINLKVANERGLREGDIVALETPAGRIEAAVYPNPGTPPEVLGVPFGQGRRAFGRYAEGRGANVLSALDPRSDRDTGSLAWAANRVSLTRVDRRIRIPKMEGSVLPVDYNRLDTEFGVEAFEVVKVTREDS